MPHFTDTAGRRWTLAFDVATLRRLKREAGIDLLEFAGGPLLEKLTGDPLFLCDVLYHLVRPEAEERSINDECFGLGLGGDVLDQAIDALLEALTDFFPQAKRGVLKTAIQKWKALETAQAKKLTSELEAMTLEEALAYGKTSTSSPESPELTPAR